MAGLLHTRKSLNYACSPALPHQTLQQALQPGAVLQAAELTGERPV